MVKPLVPAISLDGIHLLITRPQAQAQPWADKLQALGAHVTLQPMLSIEPLSDAPSKQNIIDRILNLADYQKVIFISQNAVEYGLSWVDQYWPQWPSELQFFAIGKVTGTQLEKHFEHDSLYSIHSASTAMNSEELLSHEYLQSVDGDKILIFRGKGGRNVLAEQLSARGANVDYCELYQRQCPYEAIQHLPADYRHTTQRPVVAVHSGETLENLCSIINADDLLWLQQQTILLPGQRVADLAKTAGFTHIIVADNAGHDSMVHALNEWKEYDR